MPRIFLPLFLSTLAFGLGAAEAAHAQPSPWMEVAGSLGGLVLAIIQLIVGLAIAAFAITQGLSIVSRLLGGIDIWAEIAKKNTAVALLAAGAVISYTNVIGSGIDSMTAALTTLVSGGIWNGLVGLIAGLINLAVAIAVASFAITVTFKVMDKLTKNIDEKAELSANNTAIGALYCGLLIGVSFLVSNGVAGIGKGLGMFLSAVAKAIGL
ncbi:MAG: DUF350 domain-containing protein [Planctomycetota bacterium]|nr:DUF350 domain-containing protein [Planctomycetota bacterium]MDW8372967.1 DUF350 domain-containing protein [Planctomycetota bacterium]